MYDEPRVSAYGGYQMPSQRNYALFGSDNYLETMVAISATVTD